MRFNPLERIVIQLKWVWY